MGAIVVNVFKILGKIVGQRFEQVGNEKLPPGNEINNQEDGQVQTNFQEEHVVAEVVVLVVLAVR